MSATDTNRCAYCGMPTERRYCEQCARSRKRTNGLPYMCAQCRVLDECQAKPKNRVSKCGACGKVDRCNMVRGGLCLDCWIEVRKRTNPMKFRVPTVDDVITEGGIHEH